MIKLCDSKGNFSHLRSFVLIYKIKIQIACDAFIDVNSHKKVMKKVCFYDREVTTDNENVKTFIDAAFDEKYKIIYKV